MAGSTTDGSPHGSLDGSPAGSAEGTAPSAARVITLDGPSGSGKSTVARAVATALGWRYVDTGATYRAATLAALRAGCDPADAAAVSAVVAQVVARRDLELGTTPAGGVRLAGEDVSSEIRGAEVTAAVSAVSAVPAVRALMVEVQREAIGRDGAVAEGRDVGTVVAPTAGLKVYLDADPLVRAGRRAGDAHAGVAAAPGDAESLVAAVAADLQRRDRLDSTRATSPLAQADDALRLDASALSVEQVTAVVLRLARDAGLTP